MSSNVGVAFEVRTASILVLVIDGNGNEVGRMTSSDMILIFYFMEIHISYLNLLRETYRRTSGVRIIFVIK
jgi:hypothetical protein